MPTSNKRDKPMDCDWPDIFPTVSHNKFAYGACMFEEATQDRWPEGWQKEGTLYCRGKGINRVGFAIRSTCVSWHFRDPEPLEVYQRYCDLGTLTQVTIKFKHGEAYDIAVLQKALDIAFNISD